MTLTRSALLRFVRTALQGLLSFVTVEMVTNWIAHLELDSDTKMLLTAVGTAVYSFLWRRFLDPSPVPSLVDDPTGIPPKHLADDGHGLT